MDDDQVDLLGLFTDIAIIEHLARTYVSREFPEGLEAGHFGLLNYFVRSHEGPDSLANIAWCFQEEEGYTLSKAEALADRGWVRLDRGNDSSSTMIAITSFGRKAQEDALKDIGPEMREVVSEIPVEDLQTTVRVIHEIRLILDNLPGR
jgi:hypothetical protein